MQHTVFCKRWLKKIAMTYLLSNVLSSSWDSRHKLDMKLNLISLSFLKDISFTSFPVSRCFSGLNFSGFTAPSFPLRVSPRSVFPLHLCPCPLSLRASRGSTVCSVFLGKVQYSRQGEHELKAGLSLSMCVCLPPQALIKLVCEGVCFRRLWGETCAHVEVKRPPTET